MTEEWRRVVAYEDLYEVSSFGNVRSLARTAMDKRGRRQSFRARDLKLVLKKQTGYMQVSLCRDGGQKDVSVHVLVAEAFHGPRPDGMEVLHRDADRANNRADNLRWGTRTENQQQKVEDGNHPQAKRTHCPRNHPLIHPNLVVSDGHRACKACARTHPRIRHRGGNYKTMPVEFQELSDMYFQLIMAESVA